MSTHLSRATIALVALFVTSALVGCSRSISAVKESDAPDAGFKIGQVLDHKANCASSSWSQSTDDTDRPVVEFHCDVQIPDEAFNHQRQTLHNEVTRQFDEREKGGPYITKPSGEPAQYPLSASRYDESINDQLFRSDPVAASVLDDAKKEYGQLLADLQKVDSPCADSMMERRKTFDESTEKYIASRKKVSEIIRWVLKDGQVVQRMVSAKLADGSSAITPGAETWLYSAMLEPSAANQEYAVLTASTAMRVDVGDIKYCDNIDAYRPFSARADSVLEKIRAAGEIYSQHHAH